MEYNEFYLTELSRSFGAFYIIIPFSDFEMFKPFGFYFSKGDGSTLFAYSAVEGIFFGSKTLISIVLFSFLSELMLDFAPIGLYVFCKNISSTFLSV